MTIRRLRLIAFLGFLLLVAASVGVTFAALQDQREDALVINLAGRQRMLIQRMTLEALGVQVGVNPAYRDQLHATAHDYFEKTLLALIAGGEAPYGQAPYPYGQAPYPYGQVSDLPPQVTLPPTRDPEILAQLDSVRAEWEGMHDAIHAMLESDPQSSAFAGATAALERLAPTMVAHTDEAVRLFEADAARKVVRVQYIQFGFLAAAVALLIATLVGTDRLVLNPIARLGAAIPAFGLVLSTGIEQRRHAATEAQENALRLARFIAADQERAIEGARQLLVALSRLPEVRSRATPPCAGGEAFKC